MFHLLSNSSVFWGVVGFLHLKLILIFTIQPSIWYSSPPSSSPLSRAAMREAGAAKYMAAPTSGTSTWTRGVDGKLAKRMASK